MERNHQAGVLALVARNGLLRPRELAARKIPRACLYELVEQGKLVRKARGLYALRNFRMTERHSYAQAAKLAPRGVICLLSALRFHGLTMENPVEVWLAVPRGSWKPRSDSLQLHFIQASPEQSSLGVEAHRIEGVEVRVTSVARTVADCFRFRNRIGTAVAVEALRDAIRQKRIKMDELWRYAKALRLTRVLLPYVETLQ